MAGVWNISNAVSLAIHSLSFLAQAPGYKSSTHAVAEHFGFSQHHLAKIHQRLTKAGLLVSDRGPAGGVALVRAPHEIDLLAIYESIEGPLEQRACLPGQPACRRTRCIFGDLVTTINTQVHDYFKSTTLADLIETSK